MTEAIEQLYRLNPLMESSYVRDALRLAGPTADHVESLTGGITRDEAQMLFELVAALRPVITLEVGLGYGFSAMVICEAVGGKVAGRKHIVIDPHQNTYWKGRGLAHLAGAGHADILDFHEARSFEILPQLAKTGQEIDFAFIDGWHTFDFVFVDAFFIDKMLRPGGVVVFDDADWPSIRPVLRYLVTNLDYSVFKTLPVKQSTEAIDLELGLEGSCIALRKNSDRPRDIFFHEPFTSAERIGTSSAQQNGSADSLAAPAIPHRNIRSRRAATLSSIVNTCGGIPLEHLRTLIGQLASLSDEVILFVDDIAPAEFTAEARRMTHDVRMLEHRDSPQKFVREMLSQCSCDFILRLNHDELLSPNWTRQFVEGLTADPTVNSYWIARRWLIDETGRYLSSAPHFPDYQMRLTRNLPSLVHVSDVLHEPARVDGDRGWISSHAIHHYDLVWNNRAEREAKVQRYAALRPDYTGAEYYLFEDHPYTVAEPEAADPFATRLWLLDQPLTMRPEQELALRVAVHNTAARVLTSQANPPVFLAYHWFATATPGAPAVVRDGMRTPLRAGEGLSEWVMKVRSPSEPGNYLLQVDIVEEGVTWFSEKSADRSAFPRYSVEVRSEER